MKTRKKALALVLALAMLAGILSAGMFASAATPTFEGVSMQFGDPDYEPTLPESAMTITGSSGAYAANYTGADSQYYYPDTLSLYVKAATASFTDLVCSDNVRILTYADTVPTAHQTLTPGENINDGVPSDVYTVSLTGAGTVTVKNGATVLLTLSFSAPKNDFPAVQGTPTGFMGYLPLGQYARGTGWGSPYSNGGTTVENPVAKVVGGYSGTGVSLGAAGGYVQYDMGGFISDDPANPYGVDFVVYGNAFNGNPEAASVQVSQDGVKWYELAGSLYYADQTIRNADITYTLNGSNVDYSITQNGTVKASGTFKANGSGWFPTQANYGGVWKIADADVIASSFTSTSVTYSGVTLVKDTDTTNDYQFGYADVHINGSSYGAAVNPYTIANTGSGGDGFDIAWAVNADGTPAGLSSIRYIRVYTSAAMDSTGATMTVPSIFGETSAEVCGIYKATGSTTETVGTPTVSVKGTVRTTTNGGMTTLNRLGTSSCTVDVSGTGNIYINGVATTSASFTPSKEGTKVQIIVQNGEAAPYITWLNLKSLT
ncbi:hypothetical protein [Pseudoflavonifractor phocaeensis]|uniref:hypothetical protein n=1 Tax=Pseudoflavonifractor phocaeensis TaxID=1870988 RepID=UPI002109811B|nr:hypothetical protein [Pseudoflavonifractor phocaeensis]MCQ4862727.1 hypothetical protein [Pseudoflavonifractor phocaeensis]